MQIPDESSLCWTFLSTYWKVKAGRQSTCKRYVLWSWLWGWSDKHFLEHVFVEYVFLWAILNPFLLEQICDAVVLIMRLGVHFLEHFVVQYFFLWLILNPLQCIVRAKCDAVVLIMRLDVQCQALLRLSAVWRWNERKCPRIIQIQTNERRQETKQKTKMCDACTNVHSIKHCWV